MITTTTVTWSIEIANSLAASVDKLALDAKILAISPDYTGVFIPTHSGQILTVVRSWATVEAAQEWVDYITTNYDVISAVVDPAG